MADSINDDLRPLEELFTSNSYYNLETKLDSIKTQVESIIPHPSFFIVTDSYPNKDNFIRYVSYITELLIRLKSAYYIQKIRQDKIKLLAFQEKLIREIHNTDSGKVHPSWNMVLDQVTNLIHQIENQLHIIERQPKTKVDQSLSDMLLVNKEVFFSILNKWLIARDYINEENEWIKGPGALNRMVGVLWRTGNLFKPSLKWMTIGIAFNEFYKLRADLSNFKESKDKGSHTEYEGLEQLLKNNFNSNTH